MSNKRYALGGLLTLALMAGSGEASGNGRMPAANDVIFNRNNPNHMLLRTTFGFLQTRDGGENWNWICERGTGNPDNLAYDPPMALMADGTSVISVTFGGVTTSGDFCNWAPSPAHLADRLVVDSTWIPNDPAGALLLTSDLPQGAPGYRNYIWETRDNARTWVQKGVQLRPQAFLMTLEVAPSDLNRIYVTGVEYETLADGSSRRVGWLFRSNDAGATWTNRELSLPDDPSSAAYIAAIDPANADRVYLRVAHGYDPKSEGLPPTTLRVTHDGGATWQDVFITDSPEFGEFKSMLGFALSPDGRSMMIGGRFGIYSGPAPTPQRAPRQEDYVKLSTNMQNRCLKWTAAGIYACGYEEYDDFTLALSRDGGQTFKRLLRRSFDVCQSLHCPAGSSVANICPSAWDSGQMATSVKCLINGKESCCGSAATTSSCQWDNGDVIGSGGVGGTDGHICYGGGTGGTAGAPGCGAPASAPAATSCSTGRTGLAGPGALAMFGLMLLSWRRRQRRRHSEIMLRSAR